jgi:hypothetical protein
LLSRRGKIGKAWLLYSEFGSSGYLFVSFGLDWIYIAVCSSRGVEKGRRKLQDWERWKGFYSWEFV